MAEMRSALSEAISSRDAVMAQATSAAHQYQQAPVQQEPQVQQQHQHYRRQPAPAPVHASAVAPAPARAPAPAVHASFSPPMAHPQARMSQDPLEVSLAGQSKLIIDDAAAAARGGGSSALDGTMRQFGHTWRPGGAGIGAGAAVHRSSPGSAAGSPGMEKSLRSDNVLIHPVCHDSNTATLSTTLLAACLNVLLPVSPHHTGSNWLSC